MQKVFITRTVNGMLLALDRKAGPNPWPMTKLNGIFYPGFLVRGKRAQGMVKPIFAIGNKNDSLGIGDQHDFIRCGNQLFLDLLWHRWDSRGIAGAAGRKISSNDVEYWMDTLRLRAVENVGIEEDYIANRDRIRLFPNPVIDLLTIDLQQGDLTSIDITSSNTSSLKVSNRKKAMTMQ